jgi:hypothetical protein
VHVGSSLGPQSDAELPGKHGFPSDFQAALEIKSMEMILVALPFPSHDEEHLGDGDLTLNSDFVQCPYPFTP